MRVRIRVASRGCEEGAAGYWGGQGGAVEEVDDGGVPEEAEEDCYGAFLLDALVGLVG
jgi:hypothetical protein